MMKVTVQSSWGQPISRRGILLQSEEIENTLSKLYPERIDSIRCFINAKCAYVFFVDGGWQLPDQYTKLEYCVEYGLLWCTVDGEIFEVD